MHDNDYNSYFQSKIFVKLLKHLPKIYKKEIYYYCIAENVYDSTSHQMNLYKRSWIL